MVQVIESSKANKGKNKGQQTVPSNVASVPVETVEVKEETVPTVQANNVSTETVNTSEMNGENVTTATVDMVPTPSSVNATEKVKKIPLSQYKEEVKGGFNMSEYLRSLIEKDIGITTEDALIQLEVDHPRLHVKKEAFGVVLSNLKSKERNKDNPDSPSGSKGKGKGVTVDDVVAAKGIVKENGGLDAVLASIEAYRKVSALVTALGGEERAVAILTMMDELRKE